MAISALMRENIRTSSFIRIMFEKGQALKKEFGEKNVFDFSLGNPVLEPPEIFKNKLKELVNSEFLGLHRYMSNSGFEETRSKIAEYLTNKEGIKFTSQNILMTCGAAGALNIILKSILNPGEEVIIVAPYFTEYIFYITNHGGVPVIVESNENFSLNIEEFERKINSRTKAIILNTPNNPTGIVYKEEGLRLLNEIIKKKEREYNSEIFLINDAPYSKIVYNGIRLPNLFKIFEKLFIVTSHSKDLGLPGERIGYLYFSPFLKDPELFNALSIANRILGFVNAPALFQKAVEDLQEEQINLEEYIKKRNFLTESLAKIGYSFHKPEGGFYLFPKSPLLDEFKFLEILQKKMILTVPGTGFGRRGYFRIAFCTDDDTIFNSIHSFNEAYQEAVLLKT